VRLRGAARHEPARRGPAGDSWRAGRRRRGVGEDERAADSFAESDGPIESFLYGASVLHCLPVGLSEQPSAATGTVMRTETVQRYAREAGFEGAVVLPIEHDLFRFYRLS
jgi:hypothetical protein